MVQEIQIMHKFLSPGKSTNKKLFNKLPVLNIQGEIAKPIARTISQQEHKIEIKKLTRQVKQLTKELQQERLRAESFAEDLYHATDLLVARGYT